MTESNTGGNKPVTRNPPPPTRRSDEILRETVHKSDDRSAETKDVKRVEK